MNWKDQAAAILQRYIEANPGKDFITPDVRKFAAAVGFAQPADDRAWGGVMRRAKNAGVIASIGYAEYNEGPTHTRPVTLWVAA